MGLLSDLRQKRRQQTFRDQNMRMIGQALQNDLSKDELTELIDLMGEPEIQEPLFAHVEALGRQSQLDDVLRTRFKVQTARLLSDESDKSRVADILDRFGAVNMSDTKETIKLTDRLHLVGRDTPLSYTDQLKERIRQTRNDITDRVSYHSRKVHNRVRPLTDMTRDGLKGLTRGVKDRLQSFKDSYRTRALAYDNEQNWKAALDKGVTGEQIERVAEQSSLPEVRYGLIQHADSLFNQSSMTPKLAATVYYELEPYLNGNNPEHDNFFTAFNRYASNFTNVQESGETTQESPATVRESGETVQTTEGKVQDEKVFDTVVTQESSKEDRANACDYIVNYTMNKYELTDNSLESQSVIAEQVSTLKETTSFVGFNQSGEHVWEVQTDEGVERLGDEEIEKSVLDIYTEQAERHAQANGYTNGITVKTYGEEGNTVFKDSLLMQHLMTKYNIDELPYTVETGNDQPDIKQAELLGVENGELMWGVPFNGDIHKIKDSDIEQAFIEQYGESLQSYGLLHDVIALPETAEVEDTDYFDQLSDAFNQEYDEEARLMQHHDKFAPSEHDAPPLLDDHDAPPPPEEDDRLSLSFDGLDEQMQSQRG